MKASKRQRVLGQLLRAMLMLANQRTGNNRATVNLIQFEGFPPSADCAPLGYVETFVRQQAPEERALARAVRADQRDLDQLAGVVLLPNGQDLLASPRAG